MNIFAYIKLKYVLFKVKKEGDLACFLQNQHLHKWISRHQFAKLLVYHRYGLMEVKSKGYKLNGQINLDDYIHRPNFILEVLRAKKNCFWTNQIYQSEKVDKNFKIKFFILVRNNRCRMSYNFYNKKTSLGLQLNTYKYHEDSLRSHEDDFECTFPLDEKERVKYFRKLYKYLKIFHKDDNLIIDLVYHDYLPQTLIQFMEKLDYKSKWRFKSVDLYLKKEDCIYEEKDKLYDLLNQEKANKKRIKL